MSSLPPAFLASNGRDPAWLAALPGLIEALVARWSLTLGPIFPNLELNYVAAATRADGRPGVLKVSRYIEDTANEIAALRFWDGRGAARLLEADPALGALLIERVEPGGMLVEVAEQDDDRATVLTAGLLARLWRPVAGPELAGLRPLARWCAAYDRNRDALARGQGGFPADLFRRADALRADLLASTADPVALHGDMHHYNVLRAGPDDWLAIDPKGLCGDRCFDVCQFTRNPRPSPPASRNRRRLDIFCAELGLDRARVRGWCLVHAVLDACWDYEDGNPWQDAVERALATLDY